MLNKSTDIDGFSISLTELVESSFVGAKKGMDRAVTASAREGAKTVKEIAGSGIGVHPWSEEYVDGFQSHVERGKDAVSAEIGNKAKPGLVHLLEKGHATLNGGRTRAFPHMKPALGVIEADLAERLGVEVEAGLMS